MIASPVERISGAMLFTPALHADERGFFSRTFDAEVTLAARPCAECHVAGVLTSRMFLSLLLASYGQREGYALIG
jgi:hypothetical protein